MSLLFMNAKNEIYHATKKYFQLYGVELPFAHFYKCFDVDGNIYLKIENGGGYNLLMFSTKKINDVDVFADECLKIGIDLDSYEYGMSWRI
ncbi:hypothetical protein AFK20_03815 [Enhydrobacter aerosaccus]|uniref:Uncharacterized protein n=1 Tax=Enhydrobacter aerosaccus TaxID=225324 RepID=A0ABR5IML0_9HYPH|nr:hypothetical protein [Enhydrobacter aerosaccus]KND22270.1 hypothetical protein AFK20_03815 [Enhydrobacter aerosaccus]